MRTNIENDRVIVFSEGRIDSTNAAAFGKELEEIAAANPGRELVIDAEELEYISSAGLRVLLQLLKKQNDQLEVRNVTLEVYEIMDMTGFTDLMQVTKRLRKFSVEDCEEIGRGAVGTVYRVDDDTIVKVYEEPDCLPMIENEQKRAKQAFLKGIPTAISYDVVKVGDKYGSVFELLRAKTFNDLIIEQPENREAIVQRYVRFIRNIHEVEAERGELPDARNVFLDYLAQMKDLLGEALYARLRELFAAMDENLHIVHGDLQMKNVMLSGDEPLLIDMDTLSVGDPVFDLMGLCVTYRLYNEDEPENAMSFLGITVEMADYIWQNTLTGYFEGMDAAQIAQAEDRIRLVANVRFLHLVGILGITKPELKQIRVDHALAHLRELIERVDRLAVGRE
ncbi:MAG: anti-sigma factor antagonist [Oscillospiraceae bacterium]|nr:anti-sigma factor antagonist [Oscillospiraceae bacterium]